jgi:hypothetical protein
MYYSTVSLFDLDQLVKTAIPVDASEYKGNTVFGSSIQRYSNDLSASIGIDATVGLFSGGIKSSFSTSSSNSSNNSYCTIHDVIGYYRLDMDPEKVPLIPSVKNDIENLDPVSLIKKYGTHYIQSAYIGGRVSFNANIDHSVFTNEDDFKVSVNAAYEAFSANASLETGNKTYNEQSSKHSSVEVFGGDPGFREILKGVGSKDKSQIYEEWEKSLQQYMGLADFGLNGFRPISELASTPARQKQLLDAITAYLKSEGVKLPDANPVVMKNSTVMIQSTDGRFLTRPIFRSIMQVYYPEVSNSTFSGDFRIVGHYTFDKLSTDPLNSNNVVSITFDETELWPGWIEGAPIKEVNQDWYKNKYLKLGGGFLETPFAHFTEPNDWTNWTIIKVGGKEGDPIYSGDEVQIYASAVDKYLNPAENTTVVVDPISSTGKNFVWKIIVVDSK